MKNRHRVLLVDDHPIFRQGLAQTIAAEPNLTVCAQAEDAASARAAVPAHRPDLVIVDVSLKDGDGLELVKDLKAAHPALRLLVVSMHDEVLYAERALRAGALGYVMKRASTGEVVTAIQQAMRGEMFVSAAIRDRLVQRAMGAPPALASPLEVLSDRELEIYRLLGEGMNQPEVARHLKISSSTVESHVARIRAKLGLKSGGELTRHALRWAEHLPKA